MIQKDALGTRMKEHYEFRSRQLLPRRTHTIIRLDGKAFHTYTKGLERPYDKQLMEDMGETAKFLCQELQGCQMTYTQSDEISLLLTDFASNQTEAWLDGNVQKVTSVSASIATAYFNSIRPGKLAFFDSRVFVIPDEVEVRNYFVWRQQDAVRNSILMAAQAEFSHRELHGKSQNEMQEMLWQRGLNWNDMEPRFKRGTVVRQVTTTEPVTYRHKKTKELVALPAVERRAWHIEAAPHFVADRNFWDA